MGLLHLKKFVGISSNARDPQNPSCFGANLSLTASGHGAGEHVGGGGIGPEASVHRQPHGEAQPDVRPSHVDHHEAHEPA